MDCSLQISQHVFIFASLLFTHKSILSIVSLHLFFLIDATLCFYFSSLVFIIVYYIFLHFFSFYFFLLIFFSIGSQLLALLCRGLNITMIFNDPDYSTHQHKFNDYYSHRCIYESRISGSLWGIIFSAGSSCIFQKRGKIQLSSEQLLLANSILFLRKTVTSRQISESNLTSGSEARFSSPGTLPITLEFSLFNKITQITYVYWLYPTRTWLLYKKKAKQTLVPNLSRIGKYPKWQLYHEF